MLFGGITFPLALPQLLVAAWLSSFLVFVLLLESELNDFHSIVNVYMQAILFNLLFKCMVKWESTQLTKNRMMFGIQVIRHALSSARGWFGIFVPTIIEMKSIPCIHF